MTGRGLSREGQGDKWTLQRDGKCQRHPVPDDDFVQGPNCSKSPFKLAVCPRHGSLSPTRLEQDDHGSLRLKRLKIAAKLSLNFR